MAWVPALMVTGVKAMLAQHGPVPAKVRENRLAPETEISAEVVGLVRLM